MIIINFEEDINRLLLELRLDLKSPELELELTFLELELKLIIPIGRPPHQAPVILSGTPELGWDPLTCGCWQINSILANIGRRNSIRILNQYPCWWNILIWA